MEIVIFKPKTPLMTAFRSLLLTGLFALFLTNVQAQILKPVKWTTQVKSAGNGEYELIMKASIETGWHLYSQNNNADEGPLPTQFTFANKKGIVFNGKVKEVTPATKAHDPNFDLDVEYFAKEAVFSQKVKVSDKVKKISGTVYFMVCDDSRCLPPKEVELDFTIPAATENKENTPSKNDNKQQPDNKSDKNSKEKGASSMFIPSADDLPGVEQSGIIRPVTWEMKARQITGNQYELTFVADIQEGYHIDGLENSGGGLKPTHFTFDDSASLKIIKPIASDVKPVKRFDEVLQSEQVQYSGHVVFTMQAEILKDLKVINGSVIYHACDATKCLSPISKAFTIPLSGTFAPPAEDAIKAEIKTADPLGILFSKGFGWGLIALITPCVYPMIPLTVSFFTKRGEKKSSIGTALIFGLSIILIYVGLGVLISVFFGPQALNSMASNVYVNLTFFAVFMIFALSFFGAFELTLPARWTNKADAKSDKKGIIGIFFMAFTLVLVSFSCTGPFIGSLLVLVSQGNGYVGPIAGMGGFAVAFALPFVMFAAFPMLMHRLPKSGGWLNSVKVVFGFLELALALKFLSAVDLAYHWGILKREYFLAIWIIIAILLGLYLLGKIRFSHDTPMEHVTIPRLLLAILTFSFAAYMVPGLWGAPVKMLGGIAPPYQYNEGFIPSMSTQNSSQPVIDEHKKYAGLFESPFGLNAYYDYDEGLAVAKKTGKPLMVDFTGHSCTNCRKMEENVWSDPAVLNQIKNDYVLVSLYVDDKTSLPDSEKYYSKILESKVKTIGDKWSDLEASRYNTNAQPLYVLLDHNQQILNDPYSFDTNIERFTKFLQEGKSEFSKRSNNVNTTAKE